jgi:hypothetical protein
METLLAVVAAATKEGRAELAQLLAGAKPAKKEVAKKEVAKKEKVEERLSLEVLGERPEMPEEVELDEDFCHARVEKTMPDKLKIDGHTGDFLGRSSGLKNGGFKSYIFLESQCRNEPMKDSNLCSSCAKKQAKHAEKNDPDAWHGHWHGLIGEAPPGKDRMIGSVYSNKVYADWGAAPNKSVSPKKSSGGSEVKVEAKKEVKVEAKAEAKKEVKPKAKKEEKPKTEVKAAVVPPPSAPAKKKVSADLYFNAAMDCFIDLEGNCFYSDLDETTLDPIPDMNRKIGTIPKEVDREKAQPSDFIEGEE